MNETSPLQKQDLTPIYHKLERVVELLEALTCQSRITMELDRETIARTIVVPRQTKGEVNEV